MRFFDRCLEGRQIDLTHGALIDLRVSVVAIMLRVVAHVVLDRRNHALALHSTHIRYCRARREERIFSEVLEVPSVHRSPMDIYARAKQKMYASCACVLAIDLRHALDQLGIPRSGQANTAHRGSGTIVAHAYRTVRHLLFRQSEFFVSANVEALYPTEQVDLLLQRHPAEDGIDSLFDLRIAGKRGWTLL